MTEFPSLDKIRTALQAQSNADLSKVLIVDLIKDFTEAGINLPVYKAGTNILKPKAEVAKIIFSALNRGLKDCFIGYSEGLSKAEFVNKLTPVVTFLHNVYGTTIPIYNDGRPELGVREPKFIARDIIAVYEKVRLAIDNDRKWVNSRIEDGKNELAKIKEKMQAEFGYLERVNIPRNFKTNMSRLEEDAYKYRSVLDTISDIESRLDDSEKTYTGTIAVANIDGVLTKKELEAEMANHYDGKAKVSFDKNTGIANSVEKMGALMVGGALMSKASVMPEDAAALSGGSDAIKQANALILQLVESTESTKFPIVAYNTVTDPNKVKDDAFFLNYKKDDGGLVIEYKDDNTNVCESDAEPAAESDAESGDVVNTIAGLYKLGLIGDLHKFSNRLLWSNDIFYEYPDVFIKDQPVINFPYTINPNTDLDDSNLQMFKKMFSVIYPKLVDFRKVITSKIRALYLTRHLYKTKELLSKLFMLYLLYKERLVPASKQTNDQVCVLPRSFDYIHNDTSGLKIAIMDNFVYRQAHISSIFASNTAMELLDKNINMIKSFHINDSSGTRLTLASLVDIYDAMQNKSIFNIDWGVVEAPLIDASTNLVSTDNRHVDKTELYKNTLNVFNLANILPYVGRPISDSEVQLYNKKLTYVLNIYDTLTSLGLLNKEDDQLKLYITNITSCITDTPQNIQEINKCINNNIIATNHMASISRYIYLIKGILSAISVAIAPIPAGITLSNTIRNKLREDFISDNQGSTPPSASALKEVDVDVDTGVDDKDNDMMQKILRVKSAYEVIYAQLRSILNLFQAAAIILTKLGVAEEPSKFKTTLPYVTGKYLHHDIILDLAGIWDMLTEAFDNTASESKVKLALIPKDGVSDVTGKSLMDMLKDSDDFLLSAASKIMYYALSGAKVASAVFINDNQPVVATDAHLTGKGKTLSPAYSADIIDIVRAAKTGIDKLKIDGADDVAVNIPRGNMNLAKAAQTVMNPMAPIADYANAIYSIYKIQLADEDSPIYIMPNVEPSVAPAFNYIDGATGLMGTVLDKIQNDTMQFVVINNAFKLGNLGIDVLPKATANELTIDWPASNDTDTYFEKLSELYTKAAQFRPGMYINEDEYNEQINKIIKYNLFGDGDSGASGSDSDSYRDGDGGGGGGGGGEGGGEGGGGGGGDDDDAGIEGEEIAITAGANIAAAHKIATLMKKNTDLALPLVVTGNSTYKLDNKHPVLVYFNNKYPIKLEHFIKSHGRVIITESDIKHLKDVPFTPIGAVPPHLKRGDERIVGYMYVRRQINALSPTAPTSTIGILNGEAPLNKNINKKLSYPIQITGDSINSFIIGEIKNDIALGKTGFSEMVYHLTIALIHQELGISLDQATGAKAPQTAFAGANPHDISLPYKNRHKRKRRMGRFTGYGDPTDFNSYHKNINLYLTQLSSDNASVQAEAVITIADSIYSAVVKIIRKAKPADFSKSGNIDLSTNKRAGLNIDTVQINALNNELKNIISSITANKSDAANDLRKLSNSVLLFVDQLTQFLPKSAKPTSPTNGAHQFAGGEDPSDFEKALTNIINKDYADILKTNTQVIESLTDALRGNTGTNDDAVGIAYQAVIDKFVPNTKQDTPDPASVMSQAIQNYPNKIGDINITSANASVKSVTESMEKITDIIDRIGKIFHKDTKYDTNIHKTRNKLSEIRGRAAKKVGEVKVAATEVETATAKVKVAATEVETATAKVEAATAKVETATKIYNNVLLCINGAALLNKYVLQTRVIESVIKSMISVAIANKTILLAKDEQHISDNLMKDAKSAVVSVNTDEGGFYIDTHELNRITPAENFVTNFIINLAVFNNNDVNIKTLRLFNAIAKAKCDDDNTFANAVSFADTKGSAVKKHGKKLGGIVDSYNSPDTLTRSLETLAEPPSDQKLINMIIENEVKLNKMCNFEHKTILNYIPKNTKPRVAGTTQAVRVAQAKPSTAVVSKTKPEITGDIYQKLLRAVVDANMLSSGKYDSTLVKHGNARDRILAVERGAPSD